MSGHSKWSTIKRHKNIQDNKKSRTFTLISREIISAVRDHGSNVRSNIRLRNLINKAKSVNMPNENIERSIARGTGCELKSSAREMIYMSYGPNRVHIVIKSLTDNRQRNISDVKHILNKHDYILANSKLITHTFNKKGKFLIEKSSVDEESIIGMSIESEAENIYFKNNYYELISSMENFNHIIKFFKNRKVDIFFKKMVFIPKIQISLAEPNQLSQLSNILKKLYLIDDVTDVWTNCLDI